MNPLASSLFSTFTIALRLFLFLFLFSLEDCAEGSTFTLVNNCGETIWPGILSNSGSPTLETTGFSLPPGASRSLPAPTGWSGRFWARTGCSFDQVPDGLPAPCATGDCGTGTVDCNGSGATPPATLAEFTLAGASAPGGKDFYDVSLVDGYNLPLVVTAVPSGSSGEGECSPTGCAADLNMQCPAELRVGGGDGCRSACEAFGRPEFCCSGDYASPAACRPSVYSEMFKSACPRSYSYAYDDASSTFTCSGADYFIAFCPEVAPSQKSTRAPPSPPMEAAETVTEEDSWLASLAMGETAAADTGRKDTMGVVAAVFVLLCSLLL
ncbi:hypothetical protein HPP92_008189 [Vanilla planifolia]|uniref:Thaumatin-like protein 1b n=1 Tax=Vanilla planifolia TaxID=51239 RepID=A0A835R7X4_VANPL|nr:hypothetical protein HPP92_008189 [Vanilla planifolia]